MRCRWRKYSVVACGTEGRSKLFRCDIETSCQRLNLQSASIPRMYDLDMVRFSGLEDFNSRKDIEIL